MFIISGTVERLVVCNSILVQKPLINKSKFENTSETYVADRSLSNLVIALLWGKTADLRGSITEITGENSLFSPGQRVGVIGLEYLDTK